MNDNKKDDSYNSIILNLQNSFDSIEYENPQDVYGVIIGELSTIPYVTWTGIYMVSGQELILNAYKGEKTQYVRIQIGRGICGSALADLTDKIIEDVTKESNYLVRSLETRSEMAVLITFDEHIIGLIDVESELIGAFNDIDQHYLRKIIELLVQKLRAIGPK